MTKAPPIRPSMPGSGTGVPPEDVEVVEVELSVPAPLAEDGGLLVPEID